MGVLDNSPANIPQIPAKIRIANRLRNQTRLIFNTISQAFNDGSETFWNNPNASPQEIAEALGADAKEIFELHYKLGQLIGSVKPDSISQGLNLIGNFTMNEDGTVTIIPTITEENTISSPE